MPPTRISSRLDGLPWKPIHTRVTLALGIGWLLDSFEVNVIGNVLGILKKLWHLTDLQASLAVTVWLVGIMVGALVFGYLADRFGRRRLFLLTLLLYATFTVISAVSPGYGAFLFFRFLTAVGVGAEYSAVNAAIAELIPARCRGRASAAVMNFWPLGALLAAGLSLVLLQHLPDQAAWRLAFALGAVIALFSVWARRALPESPRWLVQRGREQEAEQILQQMESSRQGGWQDPGRILQPKGGESSRQGGWWIPHPERGESEAAGPLAAPTASPAPSPGFFPQVAELLRTHPGRLALGCMLDFSEAAGYYGLFAFLPLVVLPRVHVANARVPLFFLLGNVGAALGGALAAWLLDRWGRKPTVTGFYLLAALSMLGMASATAAGRADGVLTAFMAANFCATGSWVAAYPTFSEIFPTPLRSTGIGFSVAFGRIGAALAPPLLVAVAKVSVGAGFVLLASFWMLGALAMVPWWRWGPEGRGRALEALEATA